MRHCKSFIFVLLCGLVSTAIVFAQVEFNSPDVYISGKTVSANTSVKETQELTSEQEIRGQSEAPKAEVLFSSGTVELKLAEETAYVAVEEGVFLQAGDQIRTGSGSYVELGFNEEESNIVRLDADSYAILVLKGEEQLELLKGKAFATIGDLPANASFEIRTPTAIVGVRGTDWLTTVEDDATGVEAYDGNPYIKSMNEDGTFAKEATIVTAGYKTLVKRFQQPMKPQKISPQLLAQWKEKRDTIHQHAQDTRMKRKEIPGFKRRMEMKNRLQNPNTNQQKPNFRPQKPVSNKPQSALPQTQPASLPLKVPTRK